MATNNSVNSTTLPPYLPEAGGTMAGIINMGGNKITNGASPVASTDFAIKSYVDMMALIGTAVYAASASTLGTVTQSGAGVGATLTNAGTQVTFALDGVNPPVNSNVLIKNTATGMTAANEGIYTVTNGGSPSTNWVLTRATTYDTPSEINDTGLIYIQNGSTLSGQTWANGTNIVTVDTTNFSFSRFGTTGTVTEVDTAGLATGGPINTTGTVTVTAAVKSDQTTGTSNAVAVTPGVQQYHGSAVKAWARIGEAGGTYSLTSSYNVTSVTKNGTGDITLNFTTAFTSANNMCPVATCNAAPDATHTPLLISNPVNGSSLEMLIYNVNTPGSPVLFDASISVIVTGIE